MDEAETRALRVREARRSFRFKAALIVLAMAVLVDVAVAMSVLRGDMPPTPLAVAVLGGVTALLIVIAAVHGPRTEAQRLAGAPGRRDREQQARTAQMLMIPVQSVIFAALSAMHSLDILDGRLNLASGVMVGAGIIFALLPAMMVMGWDGAARKARRFLEDELTREFRARAMTTGFWVLLPGAMTAYGLGLWRPEWSVAALPVVMAVAGAAASLRFALLHRAAERDA